MELEQPAPQDSDTAAEASASDYIDTSTSPDDDLEASQDADSQEQTEDDEEVEIGDQKVALPKTLAEKLKSERMMHADYTQKTQSVAEERKQVASEREQVQKQHQTQQQYIKEFAEVVAIDNQLAQYRAVDWAGLATTDPLQVMQLQIQERQLMEARNKAVQGVTQKQQEFAVAEQQEIAKQVHEASSYMQREIPGWSSERSDKLMQYAVGEGLKAEQVTQAILRNPALAKVIHKAELYDQLSKKQAPKPQAAPAAKPALKVVGRASVNTDPAKMTDKQFAAWRQSQIKQRK